MTNKSYGFVILHYLAFDMTKECLSKLLDKFSNYDIHIVVVDNASPNKSGEKLKELYKEKKQIDIILNDKNEGFARGNNLGYRYLNEHYNLDYIIVMNNDILIEQKEFLDLIDESYIRHNYAVLGPDIYGLYLNEHQNPWALKGYDKKRVSEDYSVYNKVSKHPFYYFLRRETVGKLFNMKEKSNVQTDLWKKYREDIVLQGSCFVFSRNFISLMKECFYSETFLYMEEYILYYLCNKKGLKMVYDPNLKVVHLQNVSTRLGFNSEYKRFKMFMINMANSSKVFLDLMKEE